MCNKCGPHKKYWLHIADDWTENERIEMLKYLNKKSSSFIKKLKKAFRIGGM